MRVLVTGGTGFIGSHLVETLINKGYKVFCLVRETDDFCRVKDLRLKFIYGDCLKKETLIKAVKGIDYIYHLAGVFKTKRTEDYYQINYQGTKNMVEVCLEHNRNLKKFIYVSSLAAVDPCFEGGLPTEESRGNPFTDYGKSKLLSENIFHKYRDILPWVIIRPPIVFGPRDNKNMLLNFKTIKKGLKFILGSGEKKISVCFVYDLVNGLILSAESEKAIGQIYFIADEKTYSWIEIANIIAEVLEVKAWKIRIPYGILFIIASLMEPLSLFTKFPSVITRDNIRDLKERHWICDVSKARNELGFQPQFDFREAIKITANWYRVNGYL